MASSNTIKAYSNVVEWKIGESSATKDVAGQLSWWQADADIGSAPNNSKQPPSTSGYWNVRTITFIPTVASATGGYVQLNEKDSSGPILWSALMETAVDVYSQTYNPPLQCRPTFYASLSVGVTSGSFFVFHLA